ncbi:hypothetical protein F5B21DRAFT_505884 [Xylaria acuta]|nr:hypothetical protein F5B21DRAFT_505884 [Xylaria acuta]
MLLAGEEDEEDEEDEEAIQVAEVVPIVAEVLATPVIDVVGSRKEIQKALEIFPADRYLQIYVYTPDSGVHATNLGGKRNVADEEELGPKVCGNCGAGNHKAAFCVKTGRSGWMEACPKCDSPKHVYEVCPQRRKGEEDFIYLVFNRQRKPPVKSTMKLGKVIKNELARAGTKWHQSQVIELPYSSRFARQVAQRHPPELWGYLRVGNPTEEAKRRIPEPDRTGVSLSYAADRTTLRQQAWSQSEEEVHPAEDGPQTAIYRIPSVASFRTDVSRHLAGDLLRKISTPESNPKDVNLLNKISCYVVSVRSGTLPTFPSTSMMMVTGREDPSVNAMTRETRDSLRIVVGVMGIITTTMYPTSILAGARQADGKINAPPTDKMETMDTKETGEKFPDVIKKVTMGVEDGLHTARYPGDPRRAAWEAAVPFLSVEGGGSMAGMFTRM